MWPTKQQDYKYQGIDRNGKRVFGDLVAGSKSQAKLALTHQGFTSVRVQSHFQINVFSSKFSSKLSSQQIIDFTRSLATLLQAGLTIVASLKIINKEITHQPYQKLLTRLIQRLSMGHPLSEELRFWPEYFDSFYCELVEAGEMVGRIDETFLRLTAHLEYKQNLAKKINKAMMYPCTVMIIALGVVAVLLLKVIPSFQQIFASSGQTLPEPTRLVIAFSGYLQQAWPWILGFGFILGYLLNLALKVDSVRLMKDKVILQIPILGLILTKSIYASISQTSHTLFSAGIPIHQVLDSAAKSCGNLIYKNALFDIKAQVSSGTMLHLAVEGKQLFSETFIQLLAVGEESGNLEMCLLKLSKMYQSEVEHDIEKLTSLIEPCIMVVLGLLVGGLVLVMYLPIFDMTSAI